METKVTHRDWSKSFAYNIHEANFLLEKHLDETLSDAKGLSFSRFLILLPLHCKEHVSQADIAVFLHVTEATVSRHIDSLVKGGFLERKTDPENRRRHILSLTRSGEKEFSKTHKIIEGEIKDIFKVVPERERSSITRAFDSVIKKLLQKQ